MTNVTPRFLIEDRKHKLALCTRGGRLPSNILTAAYSIYNLVGERWLKFMDSPIVDACTLEDYLRDKGIDLNDIPIAKSLVSTRAGIPFIYAVEHKASGFYCGTVFEEPEATLDTWTTCKLPSHNNVVYVRTKEGDVTYGYVFRNQDGEFHSWVVYFEGLGHVPHGGIGKDEVSGWQELPPLPLAV